MESVNDRDTMEDMITFGQWSLQSHYKEASSCFYDEHKIY